MAAGTGVPTGKQAALAVSTTAVGLTLPTNTPRPTWAIITVETNSIRYWYDGSTPTAANGHLAIAGEKIVLDGNDAVRKFLAIRATADAVLQVTFGSN